MFFDNIYFSVRYKTALYEYLLQNGLKEPINYTLSTLCFFNEHK